MQLIVYSWTELDFSRYAGEGGERSANPNSLYFRTDAEQAAPGETVAVSFDAPGAGEAFLVWGERSLAGKTLSAKGLTLEEVYFDEQVACV